MSHDFKKDFEKFFEGDGTKPFMPEPWTTTLTDLFPKQPQDGDVGGLRAQVLHLERQVNELQNERLHLLVQLSILERQVEGLRAREQVRLRDIWTAAVGVPEWVKKHLKFLIFVCHPDRNNGRREAAEITRELLALRGK